MHEIDLMTEDRPESRPDHGRMGALSFLLLTLASVTMVLAVVGYLRTVPDGQQPDPVPPVPSSSAWSDECTAEDLEDGMCLTYDDIRDLDWHTEGP